MTVKKIITIIFIAALFIGLPLGSYYYLTTGLDFYKAQMDHLKDYGEVPSFVVANEKGDTITLDSLSGKVTVLHITNSDCKNCNEIVDELEVVQDQFSNREDVKIQTIVIGENQSANVEILGSKAKKDWSIARLINGDISSVYKDASMIEKGSSDWHSDYLVLVDVERKVRSYYPVMQDENELKKLVTHIAMLMPKEKEPEIEFRPANEM